MNNDTAITVDGLSKAFRIGLEETRAETLAGSIASMVKAPLRNFKNLRSLDTCKGGEGADTLWALRDISFEVKKGEVLGIIGRNGAGKSTLLKILSRITEPTKGEIRMRGRVSSLLEVGTGFHPELTGRENIYMNGTILGMRKVEIDRKFDEIVEFSGVERFLDTPVKRYSSGQKVRLAFAVAAHLEPEILIVDEVLAVGDAEFQRRCVGRMKEVAKGGERTVLFVSHNMAAVMNLCSRGVVLKDGRAVCFGDADECVSYYMLTGTQENTFRPDTARRSGSGLVQLRNIRITPSQPKTGSPITFFLDIASMHNSPDAEFDVSLTFTSTHGEKLVQLFSRHMNRSFNTRLSAMHITVTVPTLPLASGQYQVNAWVGSGTQVWDFLEDCMTLTVASGSITGGFAVENRGYPVVLPSDWATETVSPQSQPAKDDFMAGGYSSHEFA